VHLHKLLFQACTVKVRDHGWISYLCLREQGYQEFSAYGLVDVALAIAFLKSNT
jgi:hypothetical protein